MKAKIFQEWVRLIVVCSLLLSNKVGDLYESQNLILNIFSTLRLNAVSFDDPKENK